MQQDRLDLSFKDPEKESKCSNFCIYLWSDQVTSSELNKIIAVVSPLLGGTGEKGKLWIAEALCIS